MKKICKFSHFIGISKDNGADAYCMKDEGRLEGPFEFGEKPNPHGK